MKGSKILIAFSLLLIAAICFAPLVIEPPSEKMKIETIAFHAVVSESQEVLFPDVTIQMECYSKGQYGQETNVNVSDFSKPLFRTARDGFSQVCLEGPHRARVEIPNSNLFLLNKPIANPPIALPLS
jgi:hypothetical protein